MRIVRRKSARTRRRVRYTGEVEIMKRRVFVLAAVLALIAVLFTLSAFAADNVRYVGNPVTAENGDFIKDENDKYVPKGDGSTPDAPTTLEGAFAYFSTTYFNDTEKAGETCTIYLVEDVTLAQLKRPDDKLPQESSYAFVYAEHKHPNNPVRIESAPNQEKCAIVFPVQAVGVRYYLLNGETAFDNVVFRTEKTGFDYATIAARGNKLTIGKNVTVDTENNTKPLGVVGGHIYYCYPSGGNRVAYNADVTVLAGDYEFIAAMNLDVTSPAVPAGTSAKLTLGNVTVGTLSATNYKKQTIPKNIPVDVYYEGDVKADTFYPTRLSTDTSQANAMTFNHFLMPGSSLTCTTVDVTRSGASSLNLYFDPAHSETDASARALYFSVSGGVDNFTYGSLTDYELANGGHTVGADGKCTFCGVVPCASDDDHTSETVLIFESTCSKEGKSYTRCSKCYATLSAIVEGNKNPNNHVNVADEWTLNSAGTAMVYMCKDCSKPAVYYPVAQDGSVAVYVSADGDPKGGESAEHPIDTLAHAQDFAAKLANAYYGRSDTTMPVTIYVIGKVDITNGRKVSSSNLNKFTNCFEESNHINHPFVFTSADGAERGVLHFPTTGNSTMSYLLYGPTTFENLSFSGNIGGHTICARGFKLVLGEGLEMKDIKGKITNNDNHVVEVSDLKIYVVGGWYGSGANYPLYAEYPYSAPTKDTHADVTVLSGEYWLIAALNRGVPEVTDSTAKLTIGSPTVIYLDSLSTGRSFYTNVTADVHYKGAVQMKYLYLASQNEDYTSTGYRSGDYTVNHLFYSGCESMAVAARYDDYRDQINCYYEEPAALATADRILGSKGMNKKASFVEYCIDCLGGHQYVGNDCAFCHIQKCTNEDHMSEFVTVKAATCQDTGIGYKYCPVCFERTREVIPANSAAHEYQWVDDDGKLVAKCVCGAKNNDVAAYPLVPGGDAIVYVSDKGSAVGGFSADLPIDNLTAAYDLAIAIANAQGKEEATVYLVGDTTVPLTEDGTFVEPEHEGITITIKGYGSSAASFKFSIALPNKIEYALSGDTTFENIEFSSGENAKSLFLTARHHHLTLGENISCDFRRNVGGGDAHSGNLMIVGGCYSGKFGGSCDKTETHLTIKSGIYRNIVAGSYHQSCGLGNDGTSTLEFLGNVTVRESIYGGSLNDNAGEDYSGTIRITVKGNVSAGKYFAFGNSSSKTSMNVSVKLESGTISSGSFMAAENAGTQIIAPMGCPNANSIMTGTSSLTIFYNPNDPTSMEMCRLVKSSPDADTANFRLLSENCKDSDTGLHSGTRITGDPAYERVEPTCFSSGYEWYRCRYCGQPYAKELTATHEFEKDNFGRKVVSWTVEPDCTHAGRNVYACLNCEYTEYADIPGSQPSGIHHYVDGVCTGCGLYCQHTELDPASEVTESYKCGTVTKQTCTECGTAVVISSTTGSHNWGKYTVTVEPTDTAPGVKTRKCKDCGKVETALLYANDTTLATDPVAVDQSGNPADFAVASSKLTKSEKAALNALLQDTAYGSEVKVSYATDGTTVTNVTYSIPVPDEYSDYQNVKVVVKDDDGNLHTVDFKVEKGYIVFTF